DGIPHFVIEVEVIGSVARVLPRVHIQYERNPPIGRRARQICRVVADKGVDISVISGWVQGDERRLTVARRLGGNRPCKDKYRQQWDDQRRPIFHAQSPWVERISEALSL